MKKIYVLVIGMLISGVAEVYAQATPPTSYEVNGSGNGDYYPHGFNSKSTDAVTPLAAEEIDSVAFGAKQKYFVKPDPTVNSAWYGGNSMGDLSNFTNLASDFKWWTENGLNNDANNAVKPVTSSKNPIVTVVWGTPTSTSRHLDSLKFEEVPPPSTLGTAHCSETTAIAIELIPQPSVKFIKDGNVCAFDTCVLRKDIGAGVKHYFPIEVSSKVAGNQKVQLTYEVANSITPATAPTLPTMPITVESGQTSFPIIFNDYGTYTVTLTMITDRISRKSTSTLSGNILTGDCGSYAYTFTIMKPAQPGPVYRIPNDYE